MVKTILYPKRVRAIGNLITDWGTTATGKYHFEKFNVDVAYINTQKVKGVNLFKYKMTPKGEPLTMTLVTGAKKNVDETGQPVIITATLTDKDKKAVVNQEVRISEGTTVLDQQLTDKNGQISYNFLSSTEGTHTLTFYTVQANGYSPVRKQIQIKVLYNTTITLNPSGTKTVPHGTTVPLTIQLKGNNKGIPSQAIRLVENENNVLDLKSQRTDQNGTLVYKYTEPSVTGKETEIKLPIWPSFIQNNQTKIQGKVYDTTTGNVIKSGTVYLYWDYNDGGIGDTFDNYVFTIYVTFNDTKTHNLHLVYLGEGTATNPLTERDKLYNTYAPCIKYFSAKALKAPLVSVSCTPSTLYLQETTNIGVTVTDTSNTKYDWTNHKVDIYVRKITDTTTGTWEKKTATPIPLTANGTATFKYIHNITEGTFQIKAVTHAQGDYTTSESSTFAELVYKNRPVKIVTTLTDKNIPLSANTWRIGTSNADGSTTWQDSLLYYLQFNATTTLTTGTTPIANQTVLYYLDTETSANLIGTGRTTSTGKTTITLKKDGGVKLGSHTLITKFNKGTSAYATTRATQEIIVTKRTRTLNITAPTQAVTVNKDFTIKGKVTSTGDNIKLYKTSVKINDGTTTKTVQTNTDGIFTSTWKYTKAGSYTYTFTIDATDYYTKTSGTYKVNVVSLAQPTGQIKAIDTLIGKSTKITATGVPTDAQGTFSFILKDSTGKTSTIASGLKVQSDGTVSTTTTWSKFEQGKYTYMLYYTGCTKYTQYKGKAVNCWLAGPFTITSYNITENNNITATAGSLLTLEGDAVKNPWDGFSNYNIEFWAGGVKKLTIKCTDGHYNQAIDLNKYNLSAGTSYDCKFICRDTSRGIVTERKFTLVVSSNTNTTITTTSMNTLKSSSNITLTAIVPADATGDVLFQYGTLNTKNSKTVTASTGTLNTDKTYKTVKVTIPQWSKEGLYYYTATLKNDKTYQTRTSPETKIYVRTKPIIYFDSIRAWRGYDVTTNLTVINTIGENYNGTLKITYNGTTSNITITNGHGTYTVKGTSRNNTNTLVIPMTATFTSSINSSLNTTTTAYDYLIPYDHRSLFVKSTGEFTTTDVALIQKCGISDVFVVTNVENGTNQTLMDHVITLKENANASFRIHAVITPFYNNTTDTPINDTSKVEAVNNLVNTMLDSKYKGKLSGICFRQMHLTTDSIDNPTKQSIINNAITSITANLKKRKGERIMRSISTFSGVSAYGLTPVMATKNFDYVLLDLPVYSVSTYNTNPTSSTIPTISNTWIYEQYISWKQRSGNNNIIPRIWGYGGTYTSNGKTLQRAVVPKANILAQLQMCVKQFDHPHYHIWRSGAGTNMTSEWPTYSEISDTTDTTTNTKTYITIVNMTNNTISKSTALSKGLAVKVVADYGIPIRDGTVTLKIGSTILKDANGKSVQATYKDNTTVYMPVNLNTYANNTEYTLTAVYAGSTKHKLKGCSKSFTVKFTT